MTPVEMAESKEAKVLRSLVRKEALNNGFLGSGVKGAF